MNYYDYSRGLNAPYSIQVLRTRKHIIWVFAQPVSLAFFGCFLVAFVLLFRLLKELFVNNGQMLGAKIALEMASSYYLANQYVKTEIDGKNCFQYLKDMLKFVIDFVLDKREMYRFERVKQVKEFSFKR
ncbi:TcpE family protein [Pilibacter termitis]|uniref:TcpE family protein n=1 Tax=Pilibacter termitis TaxID=263852 RepID=A0A1T4NFE1_9ENTE|nr:TcpE family conjugal transfer membrane protein [Pilibacter termitis]SJZ77835.1 TcpE family protein [Pilibacter termitis]